MAFTVETWHYKRGRRITCCVFDLKTGDLLGEYAGDDMSSIANVVHDDFGDSVNTFFGMKRVDTWGYS